MAERMTHEERKSSAGGVHRRIVSGSEEGKWGVRGLTKTAALELGRDNIRINSVHPGPVRTPMTAGPDAAAAVATEAKGLAIARVAEPEEITRLVLFVASDEASFSTGSEFVVDGGVQLGPAPQEQRAEAPTGTAV
jgi:3alpha(or 20beta)-hydroxysteroid dehydrogenase